MCVCEYGCTVYAKYSHTCFLGQRNMDSRITSLLYCTWARPLSQGEQPDPSEAPHQADASGESVQSPKLRQCRRKKSLETNAT